MEQHVEGCLHSVCIPSKIILRVFTEFASVLLRSSMTRGVYVWLCVHLKTVSRVLTSLFWDLQYTHVVTCCIMTVVIWVGVCRVLCIIVDCASCVFVCVILWNLSILLLGVFTDHFIPLWPMVFTTLYYSLCIARSGFCCLPDVYLCGIWIFWLWFILVLMQSLLKAVALFPPNSNFVAWSWCFKNH